MYIDGYSNGDVFPSQGREVEEALRISVAECFLLEQGGRDEKLASKVLHPPNPLP
ncbi:hypothetical protein GCM10022394_33820 [Zobellella aerophila]|uniref:Uncharacterized protein n=1 Tax=Zobellella aerophila TaxID=870480 RepID=A0ABP6WHN0_9GAMM